MNLSTIITQLQSGTANFNDVAEALQEILDTFGAGTSWSPTFSGSGSMGYSSVTGSFEYWEVNKLFLAYIYMTGTTTGSASNEIGLTLPVTLSGTNFRGGAAISDGSFISGTWYTDTTTRVKFRRYDGANFGVTTGRAAGTIIIAEIA